MRKWCVILTFSAILLGGCDLADQPIPTDTSIYVKGTISGNFSGTVLFNLWSQQNVDILSWPQQGSSNFQIDISSTPLGGVMELYLIKDGNANHQWEWNPLEGFYFMGLITNQGQTIDLGDIPLCVSNYHITVDDSANGYNQIYLFGTFDNTNQGWFAYDNYGDPIGTGYPMYDDGTHGDVTPGDHIWTLNISLISGIGDYQIRFKNTSTSGNYQGGFNILANTNSNLLAYTMPLTYLTQDTVVLFQVDVSAQTHPSVGLRGSVAPLSWNTSTVLYDDGTHGDTTSGDAIYSGLVTFTNGSLSIFEYKFVIGSSPFWERDFLGNRSVVLDPGELTNILPVAIFDN